jgi:pyridoxine/pyridoxamine 5'-phosphate oxidase
MERFTDLDALIDHVWSYAGDAGSDSQHPFRTPAFGTAGIDPPNLRTVVIRHVDPADRVVAFHSDRRAGKIGEIRAHDRIAWHGWDPERSQQILLHGTASVHTSDAFADRLWEQGAPQELKLYVRPKTPGTPLDEPGDGLADSLKEADAEGELTREDVAPGRRYFAAIRTVIDEVFFLHLHPDGHYRARFRHEDDGWDGEWIVP